MDIQAELMPVVEEVQQLTGVDLWTIPPVWCKPVRNHFEVKVFGKRVAFFKGGQWFWADTRRATTFSEVRERVRELMLQGVMAGQEAEHGVA